MISFNNIAPIEIIKLVDGTQPKQAAVAPISNNYRQFVTEKITELLNTGVIVESNSPWRHNSVIVSKADTSPRMAINYKIVNNCTVFDAFPLQKIDDLIRKLSSADILVL